jgi:ATP-dependent exoDNAse (exonuclease V) beta subunit
MREDSLPRLEGLILEEFGRPAKAALEELLAEFHCRYTQWKINRALLDFADLEIRARDLIAANPQVADQVRERFKYILVDEFQDTNRLQKEILDHIRRPGNLFAVGDLRQSIYGFRNAQIEVFESHHGQTVTSGGAEIRLQHNFRSRPELIEFVNFAFSPHFEREWKWDTGELYPAAEFDEKEVPSVELILAQGEDAPDARSKEAQALARRIADLVGEGRYTYRDFALLLRSTTNVKVYERALSQVGVPFYVEAGRGLFNAREVVDLLCLLKVLSNPGDDVSLAAVLRSPFVGLSDDALFWLARHAQENGRAPLIQAIREMEQVANLDSKERRLLCRFMNILKRLRARQGRVSLAQLISDALTMTGYLRAATFSPDGARIYANLRKVAEFARTFEERGIFELSDFLELIREFYLREVREPEALLSAEKEDVVKLMTVHAAKGMEFPVVAVVDLNWAKPASRPVFNFSPDIGLGFRLQDDPDRCWSLSYRAILEQREMKEKAESIRLLYVAATRAKEQLIFSAGVGKRISRGSWLEHLQSVMNLDISTGRILGQPLQGKVALSLVSAPAGVPEGEEPLPSRPERVLNFQPGQVEFNQEIERKGEQIIARVGKPMPKPEAGHYLATASELLMFNSCPRLYYLRHCLLLPEQLGQPESPAQALTDEIISGQDELTASVLGSAAHQVFHDYPYQESMANLASVIQDALATTFPGPAPREAVKTISSWVSNFYAGPLGKRVIASVEAMKEVDFVFRLSGLLIRGRIDLVIRENGSYSIIDYKSDQVAGDRLEERASQYQLQLLIYALAGQALFGDYPREALLYFLRPGQVWSVPLTSENLEETRQCIRRFNAAFNTRQFPPNPSGGCGFCAYETMVGCGQQPFLGKTF